MCACGAMRRRLLLRTVGRVPCRWHRPVPLSKRGRLVSRNCAQYGAHIRAKHDGLRGFYEATKVLSSQFCTGHNLPQRCTFDQGEQRIYAMGVRNDYRQRHFVHCICKDATNIEAHPDEGFSEAFCVKKSTETRVSDDKEEVPIFS